MFAHEWEAIDKEYKGQVQPNRIINLIRAIIVQLYSMSDKASHKCANTRYFDPIYMNKDRHAFSTMNTNFLTKLKYKIIRNIECNDNIEIIEIELIKNFNFPLSLIKFEAHLNLKYLSKRKIKCNDNIEIDLILFKHVIYYKQSYEITKIYFIQESDDDIPKVVEQARNLEEEDLLRSGASDDDDSTQSNELDNTVCEPRDTLFIPDASMNVAGSSSEPPPVFNVLGMQQNILRRTALGARRSSLSVNDEVSNETLNTNKEKEEEKEEEREDSKKKGGKAKTSNKDKQPVKRSSNEEDRSAPKKKTFKRSYADVAKEGGQMCEIRRSNGEAMNQEDYDRVIVRLMYELMAFQMKAKNKDRDLWKVEGSGLSRSAVWLGAGSNQCVDFLRRSVPRIRISNENEAPYQFFGPGERPFRNLRWRVPYMWCRLPLADLQNMVLMCNPELWALIEKADGSKSKPVWRIKRRIPDKRDVMPEDGTGFVSFLIEVEEDLMRILVEECLGTLRIGATEGRLTGSGIVTAVRDFLGVTGGATGDDDENDEEIDEGNGVVNNDGNTDGNDDENAGGNNGGNMETDH